MVYSKKSIEVVNKLLNVGIFVLILVIFYLMGSLVKKEYFMNYTNPRISLDEPKIILNNPELKLVRPNVSIKNPSITAINPQITLEDPDIILHNPELTAKNARLIIDDAKILLNNPELMMTNVAITDPFNNSANNGIATTAPSLAAATNNATNNATNYAADDEEVNDITTATTSVVAYIDINSNGNHVENFLAYLDEQKYCPNIYNSLALSWVKFPEKYGGGYLGKFCCVSCYHLVCKEIYCGDNQHGAYVLDRLTVDDVARLKDYYDCVIDKFDFNFPAIKLNTLIGKAVLKYKFDGDQYYPIQVIKTEDELYYHEESPAVAENIYIDEYVCELPQTSSASGITSSASDITSSASGITSSASGITSSASGTISSQSINVSTSCSQVGGSSTIKCHLNNNNNNISTTGSQVLPISTTGSQVLPISAKSNLDYNLVSNNSYFKLFILFILFFFFIFTQYNYVFYCFVYVFCCVGSK